MADMNPDHVLELLKALPQPLAGAAPSYLHYNMVPSHEETRGAIASEARHALPDARGEGYSRYYLGEARQSQLIVSQQVAGALVALRHAPDADAFAAYLAQYMGFGHEGAAAERLAEIKPLFDLLKPLFTGDAVKPGQPFNEAQAEALKAIVTRGFNQNQQPEGFEAAAPVIDEILADGKLRDTLVNVTADAKWLKDAKPNLGMIRGKAGDVDQHIGMKNNELLMVLQAARRYGGIGLNDASSANPVNKFDTDDRRPFPDNLADRVAPVAKRYQSGVRLFLTLASARKEHGDKAMSESEWQRMEQAGRVLHAAAVESVIKGLGQSERDDLKKLAAEQPAYAPLIRSALNDATPAAPTRLTPQQLMEMITHSPASAVPSVMAMLRGGPSMLQTTDTAIRQSADMAYRAAFAADDPTLKQIDALTARLKNHAALTVELEKERDAVLAQLPPGASRDPLNAEIDIANQFSRTMENLKDTVGIPVYAQGRAYGIKMVAYMQQALEQLIGKDSPDRILALSTAAEMGTLSFDTANVADQQMINQIQEAVSAKQTGDDPAAPVK
ncbi:hypothetical protein GC177_02980 [bacterium]|nr:hypothetical protein [bacterium]